MSSHSLLQGNFPTQGSNPGLLHCRRTLSPLRHQGSLLIACQIGHIWGEIRCGIVQDSTLGVVMWLVSCNSQHLDSQLYLLSPCIPTPQTLWPSHCALSRQAWYNTCWQRNNKYTVCWLIMKCSLTPWSDAYLLLFCSCFFSGCLTDFLLASEHCLQAVFNPFSPASSCRLQIL